MAIYLTGRNANLALSSQTDQSLRGYMSSRSKLLEGRPAVSDLFVAMDLNLKTLKELKKIGTSPENAILLRFEPEVVCPLNYNKDALGQFGKIIDIGRQLSCVSCTWEFWPQTWVSGKGYSHNKAESRIENRLVMINANKLSLIPNELYSLRRDIVRSFPVDIYGPNWDAGLGVRTRVFLGEAVIALRAGFFPRVKSARGWFRKINGTKGPVHDKMLTLSKYKISVVIENSPEYLSEKLFDALFARCIPIYVGPKVEAFGIPSGLVLESEPNSDAIQAAFEKAQSIDYLDWVDRVSDFLYAPETSENWASNNVFHRILNAVEGDLPVL